MDGTIGIALAGLLARDQPPRRHAVKCVYLDYGQVFAVDSPSYHPFNDSLWGAGAGVNFNLGPHVESHVMVAWPLLNSQYSTAGRARLEFSLSAQL